MQQLNIYLGKDGVKSCCWPSRSRKTCIWNEKKLIQFNLDYVLDFSKVFLFFLKYIIVLIMIIFLIFPTPEARNVFPLLFSPSGLVSFSIDQTETSLAIVLIWGLAVAAVLKVAFQDVTIDKLAAGVV